MAIYIGNQKVAPSGIGAVYDGNSKVYEKSTELTELCFTAEEPNSTVGLKKVGRPYINSTQYSYDRTTWYDYTVNTTATMITLANVGDKIYFRNNLTSNNTPSRYLQFVMTGKISASGNVYSMVTTTGFNELTSLSKEYCCAYMFYWCKSLTTAPQLPATTLAISCYNNMFSGCKSLTTVPQLPATTLASSCYSSMFSGCTSLTTVPQLPATTLASSCYSDMFSDCTSLTSASELPATTLAYQCYGGMFTRCTSLTTAPPQLPATTMKDNCYTAMFYGCTSLTIPPQIFATTSATSCFNSMFTNCTSLNTVPKLYTRNLSNYAFSSMFAYCRSLYVSDTQTSVAQYEWRLPQSSTFYDTTTTYDVFAYYCLGTRSSDDLTAISGSYKIYYTQNPPV